MRAVKAIWLWLQVIGGVIAVGAICWLAAQYAFNLRLLNVQTGSMRPTFGPGDALIMRKISPKELRPGMVVSYHSPRNPNELITHRIVKVTDGSFQTKGDALSAPDPIARDSLVAGRVVAVLPGMGKALNWLRTLPGLTICIYLPAAAIAAHELARLNRHYARLRPYRLRRA